MIIIRYLVWETFKRQLAILLTLLVIFYCQKLVRILSATANGEIPANLLFFLLGLGVPEMAQLILPLSLFLGLLMTFSKLYVENEIIVMHACGLKKAVLVKAAMILALLAGIVMVFNVMWIGPICLRHQDVMIAEIKANPSILVRMHGMFRQATSRNAVLFIESIDGVQFKGAFLAQLFPKGNSRPSIVVANSGKLLQRKDGSQIVTLDRGTRFEGTEMMRDFCVIDFQNYQEIIEHKKVFVDPSDAEKMEINTLVNTKTNSARAELHWRITLVFTVFMMTLMVVPLSLLHQRKRNFLPILLYLVFFLLQTTIKSNGAQGRINPMIWSWTINGVYFLIAIGLNVLDTAQICYFRARFLRQKGI